MWMTEWWEHIHIMYTRMMHVQYVLMLLCMGSTYNMFFYSWRIENKFESLTNEKKIGNRNRHQSTIKSFRETLLFLKNLFFFYFSWKTQFFFNFVEEECIELEFIHSIWGDHDIWFSVGWIEYHHFSFYTRDPTHSSSCVEVSSS